ncbi:hypothetical protein [Leucobacter tenebrionis]|uniref:hypothetical protein n=1 Tax=Leucobacter tenebrionis TaxID=2873270 RepID=UPI001CA633F7|nr:hypothetical protein [Leucobacter tenebrionis]QZY52937.1 hypothetical protein KVY00_05745 [Leucobacter tenebrionis]
MMKASSAGSAFLGILLIGATMLGCSSPTQKSSSENGDSTEDTESAIYMVYHLLGGEHTQEEIATETNKVLSYAGQVTTDAAQEALWDSILNVKRGLEESGYAGPDSMQVLECIPSGMDRYSATMTEAVAYCSLEVAGIPESQW